MILQEKLSKQKYHLLTKHNEKKATKSLTIPDQGFNLTHAMQQYKKGQLIERVKGYYDQQGMESPDFNMMDKFQKLQALADFRTMRQQAEDRIKETISNHKKKLKDEAEKSVPKGQTKGEAAGGDTNTPPDAN